MKKRSFFMETNEITSALIKSSNEDDTKNLENVQTILDYYRKSDNPKIKELIYGEYNRFAEAVNKIIEDEQNKGEN